MKNNGRCKNKESCKFNHPPGCIFHERGNCREGTKCKFLHAKFGGSRSVSPVRLMDKQSSSTKSILVKPKAVKKPKDKKKTAACAIAPMLRSEGLLMSTKGKYCQSGREKGLGDQKRYHKGSARPERDCTLTVRCVSFSEEALKRAERQEVSARKPLYKRGSLTVKRKSITQGRTTPEMV